MVICVEGAIKIAIYQLIFQAN